MSVGDIFQTGSVELDSLINFIADGKQAQILFPVQGALQHAGTLRLKDRRETREAMVAIANCDGQCALHV